MTFHDKAEATQRDLSAQFYLTEEDIGKNRAEACRDKLQELNTAVAVSASTADLTGVFLKQFQVRSRRLKLKRRCVSQGCACYPLQVVVVTSASLAESKRIDEFCHTQQPPIAFISAQTRGVFASVFTDFGPAFTVVDVNGETPVAQQGHS